MQDGHGRGIQCGSDRHEWSLNEGGGSRGARKICAAFHHTKLESLSPTSAPP